MVTVRRPGFNGGKSRELMVVVIVGVRFQGLRRKGGSTILRFGGGLDGTAVQGGWLEEGGVAVRHFRRCCGVGVRM